MVPAQPQSDLTALSKIVAASPPAAPEQSRAPALFGSLILHALIIGLVFIVGLEAVGEARRQPAPLMVANWTPPPPPPVVVGAPPQLPIPGGARAAVGPALRGRTNDAEAAAEAAQQLARLEPEQRAALEARPDRIARTLGFGAVPADALRSAGFAAERKRVAFILDASGPMVGVLQAAQHELARRLAQLTLDQQYVVIVIRGSGCETVPGTPSLANRASIDRTLRWVSERAEPGGIADLGAALECAWKELQPDGVCILSRGISGARARGGAASKASSLAAAAERLNPLVSNRRTATFLCIEMMDASPDGQLQQVGRTHGGLSGYQFLSRTDLGLAPRPTTSGKKP